MFMTFCFPWEGGSQVGWLDDDFLLVNATVHAGK